MAKKKIPEVEYRLIFSSALNERTQKPITIVKIETTKVFASFRYELSIQEKSDKKKLRYKILGLKAPQLSLPASGSAQFIREYERFKGKYSVVVESLDGTENEFLLNFLTKETKILSSPKNPFIELVVA